MKFKKILGSISNLQKMGIVGVLFMIATGIIIGFIIESQSNNYGEMDGDEISDVEKLEDSQILELGVCYEEGEIWVQSINDLGNYICKCLDNIRTCELATSERADNILNTYQQSIDYSCRSDADCTIKDIRNCCGYYPKCVNSNAVPNQELVIDLCEISESMPICGFQTINNCVCIDNTCQGII